MKNFESLLEGNRNYRSKYFNSPAEGLTQPRPQFIVLSCSDSRICPELALGCDAGEVFAIRNPGGLADQASVAYIRLAVEAFGVRKILVLPHLACAAHQLSLEGIPRDSSITSAPELIAHFKKMDYGVAPECKSDPRSFCFGFAQTQVEVLKRELQSDFPDIEYAAWIYDPSSGEVLTK